MSYRLLAHAGITEVGPMLVNPLLHEYHMEVEQIHFCLLLPYLLCHRPGISSLSVKLSVLAIVTLHGLSEHKPLLIFGDTI